MQHQRQRPGLGRRDLRQLPRQPAADRGLRAEDRAPRPRPSSRRPTRSPPTPHPRHSSERGRPAPSPAPPSPTCRPPTATRPRTPTWRSGQRLHDRRHQQRRRGTITMTGFAPTTSLPVGTVLTGARLKVTHRSTGNAEQDHVHPEPRAGDGRVHAARRGPTWAPRTSTCPCGPGGAPSRKPCTTRDSPAPRCRSRPSCNKTQIVAARRGPARAHLLRADASRPDDDRDHRQHRRDRRRCARHPGVGQLDDALHPGHDATRRCRRSTCRSTTSTSRSSGSG